MKLLTNLRTIHEKFDQISAANYLRKIGSKCVFRVKLLKNKIVNPYFIQYFYIF